MSREIFKKIAEEQVKGLMFHSDMADYYAFLHLNAFKEFHDRQYMEESCTLRKIKDYFIEKYNQTLVLGNIDLIKQITPTEWETKTSFDIDEKTVKILLKKSLEAYHEWEISVCDLYTELSNELFENGCYDDYRFVRCLIDDVELEKSHIRNLMLDLQAVDYDVSRIKGLEYKLKMDDKKGYGY